MRRTTVGAAFGLHCFFHLVLEWAFLHCGVLEILIQQLELGRSLSTEQVREAVVALVDASAAAETKADFLSALGRKGESVEEIAAFARELRARAVSPPLDAATRAREILDVVGTGGDQLNTFNISTTVAFIAAASGVIVAKHGNRAITSRCGSADLLEALGVKTVLAPDEAARWLRDHQFAFFFAPAYHPAFKEIAPARKLCAARGQRTLFNFLGPLLNPVQASAQLTGVPRPELCEPMARVMQALGVRRGMVVCGQVQGPNGPAWLDELSTLGDSHIAEFYQERAFATSVFAPSNFSLQPATLSDLTGADRETNARLVLALLTGEDRGPKRDAVLLNAAASLFVAGRATSLAAGWDVAAQLIDDGAALAKLREVQEASRATGMG